MAGALGAIGYPGSLHATSDGNVHSIEVLYLVPRILMGLLAVVDTFLIYKIAENLYGKKVALIASILFAVMPLTWLIRRVWLEPIQLPFILSSILYSFKLDKKEFNKFIAVCDSLSSNISNNKDFNID